MNPLLLAEHMVRTARAEASQDRVIDERVAARRVAAGRPSAGRREVIGQLQRILHPHRPALRGR
jgi:hypothetical protein